MEYLTKIGKFWKKNKKIFQVSKEVSLIGGLVMLIGAGNQYTFSLYSSDIRLHMNFNIAEVNLMGTTLNVAAYFGIIMSFFYDIFGPKLSCCLCSVLSFSGYFLIYLCSKRIIFTETSWVWFCFFFFLVGSGSTAMYSTGMATNLKNYHQKHRGKIVGISAMFYGMSSGIFGLFYKYLFNRHFDEYLLFLSIFLGIAPLVCFWILNVIKKDSEKEENIEKTNEDVSEIELSSFKEIKETVKSPDDEWENEIKDEKDQLSIEINTRKEEKEILIDLEKQKKKKVPKKAIENVPPWKLFCSLDFYLIVAMLFVGTGSGLIIMNDSHEVVISLGGISQSPEESNSITGSIVIIVSVFNVLGRFFFGFVSDFTSNYLSRSGWFCIAIFGMSCGQLCCAFSNIFWFYFSVSLCGFSYGGIFSTGPALVSEKYGEKFFAMNLSICQFGCAFGSFILASILPSFFFLHFSENFEGKKCYGKKCFQFTFMITSILCFIGCLVGLLLHFRTRKLYENLYTERNSEKK